MALDGALADLADPSRATPGSSSCPAMIRARSNSSGTTPPTCWPRRCRRCSRHAGDHRPGDRERLLLRLRPQRALHARGFPGHRGEDARDHRARQALHQGGLEPRQGQAGVRRQGRGVQDRARSTPSRSDQRPEDLRAGRLVRPLPRPAHDLDGQDRRRLQADEGGRRLLARRQPTTRC